VSGHNEKDEGVKDEGSAGQEALNHSPIFAGGRPPESGTITVAFCGQLHGKGSIAGKAHCGVKQAHTLLLVFSGAAHDQAALRMASRMSLERSESRRFTSASRRATKSAGSQTDTNCEPALVTAPRFLVWVDMLKGV
jgi:hypothetical protein